jgi:Domain of unknown function (DU1801)
LAYSAAGLTVAKPPKELLDLLKPYNRGIQELTIALRQLVLEEMAPCCEYILEVYIVAMHYGPTHRLKDAICYIGVLKDHVNLGFLRGSELADPQRILDGTGKQMRHIKIRNMSDLLRPSVRAYLQEACERAGYEVASEKAKTVSTVVKRKSLPKRAIGTATS